MVGVDADAMWNDDDAAIELLHERRDGDAGAVLSKEKGAGASTKAKLY